MTMSETAQSRPNPGGGHPIVTLNNATRTYGEGTAAVHALDGIDLEIYAGQYVVVLGPSGSGKTTLLNAIGGINTLTSGTVEADGERLDSIDSKELVGYRRDHVAFIFQLYNLVPTLTALENVQLICELTGGDEARATAALESVGLGEMLDRFPSELSGGQQQRVAVARALAKPGSTVW